MVEKQILDTLSPLPSIKQKTLHRLIGLFVCLFVCLNGLKYSKIHQLNYYRMGSIQANVGVD